MVADGGVDAGGEDDLVSDRSDAMEEAERCAVAHEAVGAACSTGGREVDGVGEVVAVGGALQLGVELESAAAAGLLLAFDVRVVAAFEAVAAGRRGTLEGCPLHQYPNGTAVALVDLDHLKVWRGRAGAATSAPLRFVALFLLPML